MRDTFLPFAQPDIGREEVAAVSDALMSGWVTTGPQVSEFEAEFARRVGAAHSLAVNSCTAALHLALEASGVGPGDEVITTPYTFAATAAVIVHRGATPVFADICPDSLNIDPRQVEAAVTANTKALLPVHFAGRPARLDDLYAIASRHGLAVVEDAAHALPAVCCERHIGADLNRQVYPGVTAHSVCFSFYATKPITTGEGGMLCTSDPKLDERARTMGLHGLSRDAWDRYAEKGSWFYEVAEAGFKYNMSDTAAALGRVQLRRLDGMYSRRRRIADIYSERLGGLPELDLPSEDPGTLHAWHLYPLRLRTDLLSIDRGAFINELRMRNIGTSVHFIPLHIQPFYRDRYGFREDDFPIALREYEREISLPIYSTMTEADAHDVSDAVASIVGKSSRVP